MKAKLVILILFASALAALADSPANALLTSLEQRLQSLKSLEIRYEAESQTRGEAAILGRMVWIKPDRFFHDTPEWTLAEADGEQWRHLKSQNTLIRESVSGKSEFLPEKMLFSLREHFKPLAIEEREGGRRVLRLESSEPSVPGYAALEFPEGAKVPDRLEFLQPDGYPIRYRITAWNENVPSDAALFVAPDVPMENVIDFRGAGTPR